MDSETGSLEIRLDRLPNQGGTFEKPETVFDRAGSIHEDEEDED